MFFFQTRDYQFFAPYPLFVVTNSMFDGPITLIVNIPQRPRNGQRPLASRSNTLDKGLVWGQALGGRDLFYTHTHIHIIYSSLYPVMLIPFKLIALFLPFGRTLVSLVGLGES